MFKNLEVFTEKGQFEFHPTDNLSQVCNAPNNASGIYLIFAEEESYDNLIYIGVSGRKGPSGEIIHREDGLGGRILNGKQFGDFRIKTWPLQMEEEEISKLLIKWYVTYGEYDQVFPRGKLTFVE